MNIALIQFVKSAIIIAAIGLLYLFRLADRHQDKKTLPWLQAVLAVLAVVSVFAYFDFGQYPKFSQFLNPHDFFHYYLGSKYSREVGYLDLYPAVIVADAEDNNGTPRHRNLRRMEDYRFVPVNQVMARKDQYRNLFSEERWQAFKRDVRAFRSMMSESRWHGVSVDKGYNATPVWNMVARMFSSLVPSKHLTVLMCLDLLLLAIMFALIGWSFGLRTMLFAIVFFGTLFPMAYTHIRGAFLRLDWATMLVMAVCLIKKERYKTAGVLAAYAGVARIFPAVFVFGLGARFALDTVRKQRLERRYLEFFIAFAVMAGLMLGATLLTDGAAYWKEFFAKIRLHDHDLSPIRVGFKYIFMGAYRNTLGSWAPFEQQKQFFFGQHQMLWWSIQAVVLGASFFLVQKLEDYESIAYGYVVAFFLFAPTFYYHVMLIVPVLLFLPKIDKPVRAFGMAYLFGLSAVFFGLNQIWKLDLAFSYTMACFLMGLSLYIMAAAFATAPEKAGTIVEGEAGPTPPRPARGKRKEPKKKRMHREVTRN